MVSYTKSDILGFQAYGLYFSRRTPVLIQPPISPSQEIGWNGSGTFLNVHDRLFIITAHHIACEFAQGKRFATARFPEPPGQPTSLSINRILGIHAHAHRDVALIEVDPKLADNLGYHALSPDDVIRDYTVNDSDELVWAGWPADLRESVQKSRERKLGFNYACVNALPNLSQQLPRLLKQKIWGNDEPRIDYDFFVIRGEEHLVIRSDDGKDYERAGLKTLDISIGGISGGGLWQIPPNPKSGELHSPSKTKFVGIEISKITSLDNPKHEWVRFTCAKAVFDILAKLVDLS